MKLSKDKTKHKDLKWLSEQDIKTKMETFLYYSEIIKLLATKIMKDEMIQYAGERYSRDKSNDGRYSRWGYYPFPFLST